MEGSVTAEILGIIVLVIFSAYFSATETAFTSLNRIRMKNMANDGNKRAEKVLTLSGSYDKLLTTILVGNNIVNIAMTATATVLFVRLYGEYGATVATVVITVVVLIFGEITPKNIAKEKAESFTMTSAPIISFFMTLLTPINFVFTKWKQLVCFMFKLNKEDTITDDEILTMVEEAETGGGIDGERSELIQNAIEFDELTAEDVMTPRPEMEAVDVNCTEEELEETFRDTGFSRLPVYEEDIDRIVGVIHQKDFNYYVLGKDHTIAEYVSPVVFVTETIKIFDLLRKMQKLKSHMAIVIDEYGGTVGLVTMEDIIEELVGEIYDEYDVIKNKEVMPLQNGSYRIRGSANLTKIFDYLEIEEEVTEVNTVNGWVSMVLDKLPKKGDNFTEQIDNRIVKVRVTKADDRKALEINLAIEEIDEDKSDTNNKKHERHERKEGTK